MILGRPDHPVLFERIALLERQVAELRQAQRAEAQERAVDARVSLSLRDRSTRRRQRLRDGFALSGALGGLAALADIIVRALS